MAFYALGKAEMGTILSFRYQTKPFNTAYRTVMQSGQMMGDARSPLGNVRTIIVLTNNWEGHVHGIKISQLTPTEQEYLQMIFSAVYTKQEGFYEPLLAQIDQKRSELDVLNKQREDLLRRQQRIVVRPVPRTGIFGGMMDAVEEKGRQIYGSVINKISTFGPTQKQAIPMQDPKVLQEISQNQAMVLQKRRELTEWIQYLEAQKSRGENLGEVPKDPYNMYHLVLKPLIGRVRMPMMYRKYAGSKIKSPRIVRLPEMSYG